VIRKGESYKSRGVQPPVIVDDDDVCSNRSFTQEQSSPVL